MIVERYYHEHDLVYDAKDQLVGECDSPIDAVEFARHLNEQGRVEWLEADLGAVNALLDELPEDAYLERVGLEHRRDELTLELAMTRAANVAPCMLCRHD